MNQEKFIKELKRHLAYEYCKCGFILPPNDETQHAKDCDYRLRIELMIKAAGGK